MKNIINNGEYIEKSWRCWIWKRQSNYINIITTEIMGTKKNGAFIFSLFWSACSKVIADSDWLKIEQTIAFIYQFFVWKIWHFHHRMADLTVWQVELALELTNSREKCSKIERKIHRWLAGSIEFCWKNNQFPQIPQNSILIVCFVMQIKRYFPLKFIPNHTGDTRNFPKFVENSVKRKST